MTFRAADNSLPRHSAFRRSIIQVGLTAFATLGLGASLPGIACGQTLPRMVDITWSLGPHLPQGFQDSDGGIVDNTLITAGGFAQGETIPGKVYPRGFVHETWGLDLSDPQADWIQLPDFPGSNDPSNVDGAGRQELASIVVNNELYAWGGFNYTAPFAYADGYRLRHTGGVWAWDPMPSLPLPVAAPAINAVGNKIYALGGADYDLNAFYTNTDRNGDNPGLGRKFYQLDTTNLAAGWTDLPEIPGTPRWVHATATVGDQLYVFGGATGDEATTSPPYRSVVDNWRYDTTSGEWHRLADLPVSSGNFPSGQIVLNDRFIMLVGGFQYAEVRNPDGTVRPAYGDPTKTIPDNIYFSDIWVYDTQTDQFGTATPLPNNNNLPMTVVNRNQLYLIGGETGGFTFDGELFGHHPESYFIGDMTVVFDPALTLFVDQLTGATRIQNVSGDDKTIDGYEIASELGSLDPSDATWHSLADNGQYPGWMEIGSPSSNLLAELNPTGQTTIEPGESLALGVPYTLRPTGFGQTPPAEDLTFAFSTDLGDVIFAAVVYESINNLALVVDPTTGEAGLQNLSPFEVAIDGYEIHSDDGSLQPDNGDWLSLADNPDFSGWLEIGSPTPNLLAELMPIGSMEIASGQFISLGEPFAVGGAEDLEFSFSIFGDGILDGVVQHGSVPAFLCDFDGGGCGLSDIDLLVMEIAAGGNNLDFDVNGDNVIDDQDLTDWLLAAGEANLGPGRSYIVGDANLDSVVDGPDFLVWNTNKFMPIAAWSAGDFTADGVVDGRDFLEWNTNKFTSADAVQSVPEPSSLAWLLCAAMLRGLSSLSRSEERGARSEERGARRYRPEHERRPCALALATFAARPRQPPAPHETASNAQRTSAYWRRWSRQMQVAASAVEVSPCVAANAPCLRQQGRRAQSTSDRQRTL